MSKNKSRLRYEFGVKEKEIIFHCQWINDKISAAVTKHQKHVSRLPVAKLHPP